MEKLAWLFNSDFEDNLFNNCFDKKQSSKRNQEFEYFIHLVNPDYTIFTQKKYSEEFKKRISQLTKSEFKTTSQANEIKNWCQDFDNPELLKKFQSKFKTYEFLKNARLLKNKAELIQGPSELESGYIYKKESGFSGSGHYLYPQDKKKLEADVNAGQTFLKEELRARDLDFSTLVEKNKIIAQYENYIDERFQYKGSSFAPSDILASDKKEEFKAALGKIQNYLSEYNGIYSIDSYLSDNELISVCEFNIRKTMGYVAYHIWQNYYSDYQFFKMLLFKTSEIKQPAGHENISVLSPKENLFTAYALYANSKEHMNEVEKKLSATLL